MLILTRKKNETVHIGDGVAVTVMRVSGNKVRLGISAPKDLRVLRIELEGVPKKQDVADTDEAAKTR